MSRSSRTRSAPRPTCWSRARASTARRENDHEARKAVVEADLELREEEVERRKDLLAIREERLEERQRELAVYVSQLQSRFEPQAT